MTLFNRFSNTSNEAAATESAEKAAREAVHRTSRMGSGAEQDRYEAHFGLGSDGLEKIKKVATMKGVGAEQDRYRSHFGLDEERVRAAARSILMAKGEGGEQDRYAMHFGLGADGWARAREMAKAKGEGAEQELYHSHLSLDKTAEKAAHDIKEGIENVKR
ncbi:uncharacterized protein EI97DRAFT_430177 [Westerdykella ornata]|uniref:Uncharacterized protein n=1 Tax=Westerdykella ornata TaxID=318751 RepID=A0A6A6JVP0_WESOR|nr:uncharacterized protein EI97DRAFT_430177 [Westerdykella ornata]KAF2280457.1 hypothetical protein EI97DRAFT_430177 [Westerdykella ornata]